MSKSRTGKRGRRHDRDEEKESLAFKVLSQDQTKELLEIDDVDALQDKMVEMVKASDHLTDLKDGALLDFYVAGIWWAREQTYTVEQTSAFYTVLHTLLENLKEKQMALTDNLVELKKMLAGIGQEQSEQSGGLECFDLPQAKAITDYINTSLFQHYKLYEFIISHSQAEEIIGTDLEVEVPPSSGLPWPPPMEEGAPEEIYKGYILSPPPTARSQSPEKSEEELAAERKAAEEAAAAAAKAKAEDKKVVDLLANLSPEEVKNVMNQVFDEMLGGLKTEVAAKLREKENGFINRINKVHKVADK